MAVAAIEPYFALASLERPDERQRRYVLGFCFIVLVAIVWIISSVSAQYLYSTYEFDSPFLMTYLGICSFAFVLPIKYLTDRLGWTEDVTATLCGPQEDDVLEDMTQATPESSFHQLIVRSGPYWNHPKHLFVALHIAPVMFIANWLLNAALVSTSVASATVLVSTNCLFVFILAVLVKEENFRWLKLAGVLLGICGTALTACHDLFHSKDDTEDAAIDACPNCDESDVLWGDTLAVLAAFAFAAYAVQVRLLCPQEEELYSMSLLLGYIGFTIMVLLFPICVLCWNLVEWNWTLFGLVLLRGILDYGFSEYLHFRAVILTNATVATVGLGITIPLSFIADLLVKGPSSVASLASLLGACLVAGGFLIVNIAGDDSERNENETDAKSTSNVSNDFMEMEEFSGGSTMT